MTSLRRIACSLVALLALGACNEVGFLVPPPNPRGITIPLPPPSFSAAPEQRFNIDGDLDESIEATGTRVSVYEKVSGRGYFTYSIEGIWEVPDVLVDVTDNCLVVSSTDGEGEISSRQDFKLFIAEGDACDASCTDPDDLGACVCFEKWNTGC